MANDIIQCPLCDGHSRIERSELIRLLSDRALHSKLEGVLMELRTGSEVHEQAVAVGAGASDFQTQVHSWNPANPMWKRSPKE
jgi:hypothetical protein